MDQRKLRYLKQDAKRYGFLLLKKPWHDKFLLFSLKHGVIQEGEGFTLDENDVISLLNFYKCKYPFCYRISLVDGVPQWPRLTQQEKDARFDRVIQRLEQNEKIKGSYDKQFRELFMDGACKLKQIKIYNETLEKRARKFKILLVYRPYHPRSTRYVLINMKTGKIITGQKYSCSEDEVRVILDELEAGIRTL